MKYLTNKLFRTVFENSPVGLVIVNQDTTIRDVNNYMFKAFRLTPRAAEGQKFGNIFNCAAISGSNEICGGTEVCKQCGLRSGVTMVMKEGITIPETVMDHNFIIGGNNQKKWFTISAARIEEEDDIFAIVSFADISTLKEYEELLHRQLSMDMATGSTNKYALLNTLKNLTESKEDLSIAMIDFDNFKAVNDRYGHVTGDRVLNLFCAAAAANSRKQDIVGRFGGEEFMLVFPGASSGLLIKAVRRIYNSFREACAKELDIAPTFSVGIAEFLADQMNAMDVDMIISEADANLYLSKQRGKNMITASNVSIPF